MWSGPLPDAVRAQVVTWAADTLGSLEDSEVPIALRPFRSWTPQRRRTRAGTPLAAAVATDVIFRQRVAARATGAQPGLAAALSDGAAPPAADPTDIAAVAYLTGSPGWVEHVRRASREQTRNQGAAADRKRDAEIEHLRTQLASVGERHRLQLAALTAAELAARSATDTADRALRAEKGARRRAERATSNALEATEAAHLAAEQVRANAAVEVTAARRDAAAARDEVEASRRAVREGRRVEDGRARLLLDTLVEASQALRRELGLPPVTTRPADAVAAADAVAVEPGTGSAPSQRALLPEDPALLDQLLSLPQAHLIVDGYNVTKTGFPELSLEQQRSRLLGGLSVLAGQTGAEVTCCFDGAAVAGRVPTAQARGVRVLFSQPGQSADDLIRRLARAEPTGRPVCVVSSDREVADGVRRWGARPVSAIALVRRLSRG